MNSNATGRPLPTIILIIGCLMAAFAFGPRSSLGFFLSPISFERGWSREVIALTLAIQMLVWGVVQPIAGAIADRFGVTAVFCIGAILYSAGLCMMAYATTAAIFYLSGGLVGIGIAGCSFTLVLAAFAKLMPEHWRSFSFGAGTAAASFGQFLFSPLAVALISAFQWQIALLVLSVIVLLLMPMSVALYTSPRAAPSSSIRQQSMLQAVAEALRHRSFVFLILGYFTCGFQTFFISVHLPAYLLDRGLTAEIGGWALALIGLFNIVGSVGSGMLGNLMPKRFILSTIYFTRSLLILAYISMPPTPTTTLIFGAVMGIVWLSTVPPTSSLVAIMFGPRWLAMLFGLAFFSHQVGGFLGVWLGGLLFERTGSYEVVWGLTILLGVFSAVINLPIVEKPVDRGVLAAA